MSLPHIWANEPWELIETPSKTIDVSAHGAYFAANQMTNAHNCMIRGLNALWLQSPHITSSQDAADLLFLAHSWGTWVENHFRLEREFIFSGFEAIEGIAKGTLPHEDEQHNTFAPNLHAFVVYCKDTKSEDFDSAKFRDLIASFAEPFVTRLHTEIPTLLKLDSCGQKGSEQILSVLELGEREAANQDIFIVLPMVLGLCDKTFEGGNSFPPLPPGVAYVANYILAWRHSRAWRFLPSDHWRRPRALRLGSSGD